jgi:hypothetical protein
MKKIKPLIRPTFYSVDQFIKLFMPEMCKRRKDFIAYSANKEKDWKKVLKANELKCAWTLAEYAKGKLCITSGLWKINSVSYIVTIKPWCGDAGSTIIKFDEK